MLTTHVRVTLLRHHGRKLKLPDAQAAQRYHGSIKGNWVGTTHIVTMRTGLASDDGGALPPDLYNPVFSAVRDHGLRLHGVVLVDGAAVAQE